MTVRPPSLVLHIVIAFTLYLLIPWCRVLLEKLIGLRLVKKFPTFYGTRSIRHLSLSWASPIQSTYPHPTSWISILILSTHLRLGLPSGLFNDSKSTPKHLTTNIRATEFYHWAACLLCLCYLLRDTKIFTLISSHILMKGYNMLNSIYV